MKRFLITILALCMLLVSCTAEGGSEADVSEASAKSEISYNTKELAEKITADYKLEGGVYLSSYSTEYGEYLDSDTLLSFYGKLGEVPDMQAVEEYCVYMDTSDPNLAKEFGIFKTKDGTDKDKFLSFLENRIDVKLENAKNYPSVDTEPLKKAVFFTEGSYVVYVVIKSDAGDIADFIKDVLN